MRKVAVWLAGIAVVTTMIGCMPEEKTSGPAREKPQPLEETVWKLSSLGSAVAGGEFTEVPARSQVGFVVFSSDKQTLKGFAGCQQLEGTYVADGDQLHIATLVVTGTRCHNDRFDEIGDRFVKALSSATSLRLGTDDARLELVTGTNTLAVLHYRTPEVWSW